MKTLAGCVLAVFLGGEDSALVTLLDQVRERAQAYYLDMLSVAWTDTVRQQTLKKDGTPRDKPKELVYDMILRHQPPAPGDSSVPFYVREVSQLIGIDGKKDGPNAADMRALQIFLLAKERAAEYGYRFSYAGETDLEGRKALLIDLSREPARGRVWIDRDSHSVLKIEWRTKTIPSRKPRSSYETEMTARFKSMTFENPHQTLMVPESLETVTITADGRTLRTMHSFSNYKRFSGDIKILPAER
jgi:hypothetical protein